MSDLECAVERIKAWIRDYGSTKTRVFTGDLWLILLAAEESVFATRRLQEFTAMEGPLNADRWTLDELLTVLEKWKTIASGDTCVSFEKLCYGASSLWHQTHRDNFRAVDRKPDELSRWVLEYAKVVREDFPEQVLEILVDLKRQLDNILSLRGPGD